MKISIIGAAGGVGREIAIQLIRDRHLETHETLQLISADPHSPHPHLLHGLRADLLDAHAEIAPQIEVTNDVDTISGDIVIMTAGRTFATSPTQINHASRDELALGNRPIFERCAQAVAQSARATPPFVIIVTNPVELGVQIFTQYLPRDYVIGMGAHSDSLRFRQEIAADLGVRRQRVHGYVVGEHGNGLVPLWSSAHVSGLSATDWAAYRNRAATPAADFSAILGEETQRIVALLHDDAQQGPLRAYEHIATLSPDLRVALKPLATHYTEAKTVVATAHATADLVEAVLQGASIEVAVQYQHEGEFGLQGPCGARLILAAKVEQLLPLDGCTDDEIALIRASNRSVQNKIEQWRAVN